MVRFFIDRPIFATVLSVVVTLAGSLAVGTLPLSQYPPVTPPTIQVDCRYPGASAQVVAETIAAPVEQQVNGVERMLYMTSQCTSEGSYTLTVTFDIGTDLNLAQVLVQNRVNLALPNLPDVVRATGVTTRKRSPEILLTVSLNSPDGKYDQLYLSNYAVTNLTDELARIPGISDVIVFGQRDYSMRVWVDPDKLAARNLTAIDVVNALREQNAQVAAGQLGQPPTADGVPIQLTLDTIGRLETIEEFGQIVVKATKTGQVVKLRDVARIELGAKNQDVSNKFDRKPTVGLAVFLLSGANALEVGDTVKARMAAAKPNLPPGVNMEIGYDTTPFIRESIREVVKALRDAILLVAVVVLLFLQSWRAAIIPLAAVPVAIVGTFAAMWGLGFSLNNLTLFGLVLAVGIVVDDAIVVVEAVQHRIDEGMQPREATIRAMDDVAGPIFAVGVVLAAVFVPCTFLPGIVGQFFRQFAVTIAVSTLISMVNSLTLSPALAAFLLKPKGARRDPLTWVIDHLLGWLFWLFNRAFDRTGRFYLWTVKWMIRVPLLVLVGYAAIIWGGVDLYRRLPGGFIPSQDKGYLIASVQLPDAASTQRSQAVIDKVAGIILGVPGVKHVNAVTGNSFVLSAYGSNFGSMFVILDQFDERQTPELYSEAIIAAIRAKVAKEVPEASVTVFGAPAVSGLGRAGGFRIMIEDRGEVGPKVLQGQTDNLIEKANQQPGLSTVFTAYTTNSPQVYLDVDRTACLTHGVELRDVFGTLQATMGQRYVNDFNLLGRTWQVNVQSEPKSRTTADDIRKLKVRNKRGEMVPLSSVVTVKSVTGPLVVTRHNMYPAATVSGNVKPGTSTGQAYSIMARLADQELPPGRMSYEWSELAFIELRSANSGLTIFALSVAFVFLVLAALYESFSMPFAVLLVVPVCIVGSLVAIAFVNGNGSPPHIFDGVFAGVIDLLHTLFPSRFAAPVPSAAVKQDVNIFTEVGFVVLIGLASKNAILIVEVANRNRVGGQDRRTAILAACKLRFRPIIMTSFAFILGVVPLLTATGAGAEMRKALGTAVFGGMIGVTLFGVVLTPVFFVLVDWVTGSHPWVRRVGAAGVWLLRLKFLAPVWRRVVALRPPGVSK